MTKQLDLLLKAKSEAEFIIVLYNTLGNDYNKGIYSKLTPGSSPQHGYSLRVEIEQVLDVPDGTGHVQIRKTKTHTFSLHQDGSLTWEILGHETISGLKNIQAALLHVANPFQAAKAIKNQAPGA